MSKKNPFGLPDHVNDLPDDKKKCECIFCRLSEQMDSAAGRQERLWSTIWMFRKFLEWTGDGTLDDDIVQHIPRLQKLLESQTQDTQENRKSLLDVMEMEPGADPFPPADYKPKLSHIIAGISGLYNLISSQPFQMAAKLEEQMQKMGLDPEAVQMKVMSAGSFGEVMGEVLEKLGKKLQDPDGKKKRKSRADGDEVN